MHRLTREKIGQLIRDNVAGRHGDGGNLYLFIRDESQGRAPVWLLRYVSPVSGKQRDMILGSARDVKLEHARELARGEREKIARGVDPMDAREEAREQSRTAAEEASRERAAAGATLGKQAEQLHELLCASKLKTPKARAQWLSRLKGNVPAEIWDKPIGEITELDLRTFLAPLWINKHPTAKKVRQRLDAVFHWSRHLTGGANPAAAVKRDLTQIAGQHEEESHRALPWKEMPGFIRALRAREGTSALALEFLILTAARTKEVIELEWRDIHERVWTAPGRKMKEGEPHTVFLCERALEILEKVRGLDPRIVFPSPTHPHRPMSNMSMLTLLRRMEIADRMTVHGCRGTFSTWANEQQKFSEDVIEACLAHREGDRVRRAYNRATFDLHRAQLLAEWAQFIEPGKARQRPRLRSVNSAAAR